MPKQYSVRVYMSTGFDLANLPDSPSLLDTCKYVDFPAVFEWQNRSNATINIETDWDTIKNADYLRLGDDDPTYYVVHSVQMASGRTAVLSLVRDPFLSAGGLSNITILSGWARRAHAATDEPFANILAEPWGPSNQLVVRNQDTIHTGTGTVEIAVATCDLERADEYEAQIASVAGAAGSGLIESVVWPVLPQMTGDGTTVTTPGDGSGDYSYTMPGMYAFDLSSDSVREGINGARSMGIASAILSMYVIPSQDVETTEGGTAHPNHYTTLAGVSHEYTPGQPYAYGNVKNSKAYTMYNYYTVESVASGSSMSYEARELYRDGETEPTWRTKSDPAPDGTVYCQPVYYDGAETILWSHAVASSPWYNAGFVYNGASGASLIGMNASISNSKIELNRDYANSNNTQNRVMNVVNSVASLGNTAIDTAGSMSGASPVKSGLALAGGVVSGLGTIANGIGTEIQLQRDKKYQNTTSDIAIGENVVNQWQQAVNVAPTLAFPITVTAASYFGHAYRVSQITLSDNDLARFDRFLTMYGYSQDKPLEASDFMNRTKFNYVVAEGTEVSVLNQNHQIISEIRSALAAGVRFWHILPVASAYEDNPIKEA